MTGTVLSCCAAPRRRPGARRSPFRPPGPGTRSSAKGAQLAANPVAALSFWRQPVVRAVRLRVRGTVREAPRAESAADLAARSESARAGVDPADRVLWRIVPDRIEFWQGSPDRRHTRIVFERSGPSWRRGSA